MNEYSLVEEAYSGGWLITRGLNDGVGVVHDSYEPAQVLVSDSFNPDDVINVPEMHVRGFCGKLRNILASRFPMNTLA